MCIRDSLNGDRAIDAREMQAIIARLGDRAKAIGAGVDPKAVSYTHLTLPTSDLV